MTDSLADRSRILASALDGLPEFAEDDAGLSFPDLMRSVGLPLSVLDDHSRYVSLNRFANLLETASTAAGDDTLALRFAERQEVGTAGALAYAIKHAPTVHEGFMTLVRYIRTRVDVAHMEFIVEGRHAMLTWSLSPLIVRRSQIADYAAMSLVRRMSGLIHPSWQPLSVALERAPPASCEHHRRAFGSDVHFSQTFNAIAVDAALLDERVARADPYLRRLAVETLERMLRERDQGADLLTQVREEIMADLEQNEPPALPRIARRLGLSTRNLQRRLSKRGSSFHALLDDSRRFVAQRLLQDPEVPLSQIAYRVGFSAPSAFTRAARRWFGTAPKQVRRQLLRSAPMLRSTRRAR